MGCNTSKETAPQEENSDGQKENQTDVEEDKKQIKLKDDTETTQNHVQGNDSKPASARTVTLRSDQPPEGAEEDPYSADAAVKIQAAYRGYQARRSMKQPSSKAEPSPAQPQEREPTREELEAEFQLDDPELCHAATKIQASFRGHMTRKQGKKNEEESGTSQAREQEEEELDIDLTDPELNKAAVKIQASFRGHMTRKDGNKPDDE